MSTTLIVAGLSKPGAKATAVSFTVVDGMRPWAWLPNALVATHNIRAGVTLEVNEVVAMGSPVTSYVKDGIEYELSQPKQQLMLGGNLVITQPAFKPLTALTVTDLTSNVVVQGSGLKESE